MLCLSQAGSASVVAFSAVVSVVAAVMVEMAAASLAAQQDFVL